MQDALMIIRTEHRNLSRVLDCLTAEIRDLRITCTPDFAMLHSMVYYIRVFPDQFHHPKEEQHLFPRLLAHYPESTPVIEELRLDHARLAADLTAVGSAIRRCQSDPAQGWAELDRLISRYVDRQRRHMRKEEQYLLPAAEAMFTGDDWQYLNEAFAGHQDPLFGRARNAGFDDLYRRLTAAASHSGGSV